MLLLPRLEASMCPESKGRATVPSTAARQCGQAGKPRAPYEMRIREITGWPSGQPAEQV